jgi:four helix bundle protein
LYIAESTTEKFMAVRFKELLVWQRGVDLHDQTNNLSKTFPKYELFTLKSQIKRASDCVVLNITEGSTGQTKPVFKTFHNYFLRSAIKVLNCLIIAKKRNCITEDAYKVLYEDYEVLAKMIQPCETHFTNPQKRGYHQL